MSKWRVFQSAADKRFWGIESSDQRLTENGDELIAPPCMAEHNAKAIVEAHNDAESEINRLRERLGPRGLEVIIIDGAGHYVSQKVKAEFDRLRARMRRAADSSTDAVVARDLREALSPLTPAT